MKYIVLLFALVFVCVGGQYAAYAQDMVRISALSGINADIDIAFPSMNNALAERALTNFIARQIRLFKHEVRRVVVTTGSV